MQGYKIAVDMQLMHEQQKFHNREAIVQCLTDKFCDDEFDLQKGRYYKIIAYSTYAMGYFLVIDEAQEGFWYPKEYFKLIFDPFNILSTPTPFACSVKKA